LNFVRSAQHRVAPLTDEERLTLARWIDLGCPIDLTYRPGKEGERGYGWMCDDHRPTLTVTYPTPGKNESLTRILVGMYDHYSGLDEKSFEVTADFAVDGLPAGKNLASRFTAKSPGSWEMVLREPMPVLPRGVLTVSVRDNQGNLSRVVRSFSVGK
jgi:hypothetical protein